MRPSRVLLAAVLAVSAPLFAAVDLPRENERWTRLELDDYVLYSAARDSVTKDVAEQLQLMRDGVAAMTRLNVHPPQRVTVVIFPNEREFAPFRDAAMGKKMAHVAALFGGTRDAAYILLDADASNGIDRSVYHELTHSFTHNTAGELPLWFMEGIAEFYSTFQPSGADKIRLGAPISEHLALLHNRGLIPLARLFAVDQNSADYSEQYRAGDFYAESWLLVHYLMIGNQERHKQLGTFLELLSEKQPAESAFETAFGVKYAQLETELRHYLNQPTMNLLVYTPAEKHTYVIREPQPVTRDAILLALGRFLAHSGAAADAKPFLDAALQANPKNGDVYAIIGEIADRAGMSSDRDAAYEKAVTLGTTDANAYILLGRSIVDSLGDHPTAAELEKPRALFEKAIAINPASARAYAELGATYIAGGQDEKAIIAYLKSLSIEPRDDIAFNLVTAYARQGKRELAEKMIERYIVPGGDKDLLAEARESVLMIELNRAIDMAHNGDPDEAMKVVKKARDDAKSDEMKRRAGDALAYLESSTTMSRQVAEINRAIDIANAGRYRDAVTVLDALLPSITNGELESRARELRTKFAAAARKK